MMFRLEGKDLKASFHCRSNPPRGTVPPRAHSLFPPSYREPPFATSPVSTAVNGKTGLLPQTLRSSPHFSNQTYTLTLDEFHSSCTMSDKAPMSAEVTPFTDLHYALPTYRREMDMFLCTYFRQLLPIWRCNVLVYWNQSRNYGKATIRSNFSQGKTEFRGWQEWWLS